MNMFNEKLKELRAEKKITQEILARDINVSKGAVAMWETGKREPDMNMLKTIATYFRTSVDDLIGVENTTKQDETENLPEELVILNRNAKKMSPENRRKLLEMARVMFKEDFDD